MSYLIEKTVLTIEPTLALKIGLNESIVLKQLHYWIKKSKKNHNGKKWVFNTYKQWKEQLPFFSEKTIQRIILNLKEIGLIEIQQIDKNKMNRTNFYSINYEKIDQLFEDLKISNQTPSITKQEENKKLKEKKPNEGGGFYSQEFLKFWENYPKKIGKKLAMVEFEKLEETNKEKAIFFLVAFERLGFLNNRAIYLPDSITLDKPSELIKYYPEFNGKLFYKFNDFDFDDFLLTIDKGMPKESFKNYYLAKYKKLLKYLLIDN